MTTAKTRTGGFPIGFRRGWSDWQKDLDAVIEWALDNGFGVIDLGADAAGDLAKLKAAGLQAGSVDLLGGEDTRAMLSPDASRRAAAIERAKRNIEAAGPGRNFFTVMLPEKPELPRGENFKWMIESYSALVPDLERSGGRLAVEGWPGPGALCCTPEGCRALLRELPSRAVGINFDPSHLIRMGIDPMRFLGEFPHSVSHVHGKDAALYSENLYEFGHEQPPTFARPPAFGGMTWRYTIPGHGQARWVDIFRVLKEAGYGGCVCVELEDANFNGAEETEKRGLILSREFLQGC